MGGVIAVKASRLNWFLWAIGLALAGLVLLGFNFGLLEHYQPLTQYVATGVFALAAAGFFGGYTAKPANWWRLIPGWTLLALAAMAFLSVQPAVSSRLAAAVLFLGLALAFGHIYIVNRRDNWWAIIPGGFMLVVSLVTGLSALVERLETLGAALFVGMGLVFFALALALRTRGQWWPLIPGAVLVWFGLFIFMPAGEEAHAVLRWWPLLLVLTGLGMGWRALTQRTQAEKMAVNVAPGNPAGASSAVTPPARSATPTGAIVEAEGGILGAYSQPAPGASVEVLDDDDQGKAKR